MVQGIVHRDIHSVQSHQFHVAWPVLQTYHFVNVVTQDLLLAIACPERIQPNSLSPQTDQIIKKSTADLIFITIDQEAYLCTKHDSM